MDMIARCDPSKDQWRRILARCHSNVAQILVEQERIPQASEHYKKGLKLLERLVQSDPSDSQRQRDLWETHVKLAYILRKQGELALALKKSPGKPAHH